MATLRWAIPDLISPSYFPVVAAVELGFFKEQGYDGDVSLIFPVTKTYEALRDGEIDFAAGSAHPVLHAFPNWQGAKLLCAQSQNMYWFLVARSDLKPKRGDLSVVKGLRIGAAPGVDLGLQRMLIDAGIDVARDNVTIGPVTAANAAGVSFGVTAAKALEEGSLDAFWANGMGAEVAVRKGVGTVVVDARRGDGPAPAVDYTFSCLVGTDRLITDQPEVVRAAIRAVVRAQHALKADPSKATEVGRRVFPPEEAELIAELIRRDAPFYDPRISEYKVQKLNEFSQQVGLIDHPVPYDQVVATQFEDLWEE